MSNWITDNKPAAIIAGAGLLLFLGLTTVGYMEQTKRDELMSKIKAEKSDITSANNGEIVPTKKSNAEFKKNLDQYTKEIDSLKKAYEGFYATSQLESIKPGEFQNQLKANRKELIESCQKKNITITDSSSWLGLQNYASKAPSETNTPLLNFEMKAVNTLMNRLTDCQVTQFIKVYVDLKGFEKTAAKDSDTEEEETPTVAGGVTWKGMPLEISFLGNRESVIQSVNAITGMKDYCFTINSIRIKNERAVPPPVPTAEAENVQKPAADSLAPAEDNAGPATPIVREIVKPYSGNEKVFVQISLNLVHFTKVNSEN